MKNKFTNLIFISVPFFLLSCLSLLADRPFPLIEGRTVYSNQGTRSEARHHYLYVRDRAVPDTFELVWQEGRLYRFVQRDHTWGDDGYLSVPSDIHIVRTDRVLSDEDARRKFYDGNERLDGTPEHWAYVEWKGGRAFVDPIALWNLVESKRLKPIPRMILDGSLSQ